MAKEKSRLPLYWVLNVDAIATIGIAVIILSLHLPRYFPFWIATPSALLCLLGAMGYRRRFYARMGWDIARIPPKSVSDFWRFTAVILLLLHALWIQLMGLPSPNI